MSFPVFAALLVAAIFHALWNALVRRDPDRAAASTAIAVGGAVVGAVLLPLLPPMALTALPYVVATSLIHIAYFALIGHAYRHGELSVSYPIMRGLAPLIVTIAAALFVETPPLVVVAGVVVVALGIASLGAEGLRRGHRGLPASLANAFVIAAYTLVDGLGARVSGAPVTYVAAVVIGGGLATVTWQTARQGRGVLAATATRAVMGIAGGALSLAAYGIALWAMTFNPIGVVAAVRETSVLFATALGALALRERFGAVRWIAALLVVAGLALVKLGGAT